MRFLPRFGRVVPAVAALAVAALAAAATSSGRAAEAVEVRSGQVFNIPMAASSHTTNTCSDKHTIGEGYGSFKIYPPGSATVVGAAPTPKSLMANTGVVPIRVAAKPGTQIVITWAAGNDCSGVDGSVVINVIAASPAKSGPSDGSEACGAKKNFWGWDGAGRAWWRKVYEEAHKRAQVANDWADFFDLFTWLSKLPGLDDPKLEAALAQIDVVDVIVKGLEQHVRTAASEAESARTAVKSLERNIGVVNKQLNAKQGGDWQRAARRSELVNERRALEKQLKTANAKLAEKLESAKFWNKEFKSKALDPLIDKLLGATDGPLKTGLRGLEKGLGVMSLGQDTAAVGVFGFGALAGIAKSASKPPAGCKA